MNLITRAFAHIAATVCAKAKCDETVTLKQPSYCHGGNKCGRDKNGVWYCNCVDENKKSFRTNKSTSIAK